MKGVHNSAMERKGGRIIKKEITKNSITKSELEDYLRLKEMKNICNLALDR